jgi:hypothetical protein
MQAPAPAFSGNWIGDLRRFLGLHPEAVERCELCGIEVSPRHPHLLERATRRLLCACPACALLFERGDRRYRCVPGAAVRLPALRLDDEAWAALRLPIELAFFVRRQGGAVAFYPGPAGAVESALPLPAWQAIVAANPPLEGLEDEVEALLVNRLDGARDYYRLPIDRCYELVGRLRARWRGISGGAEVSGAVSTFLAALDGGVPRHA